MNRKLVGLTRSCLRLVERVRPGLPLFLFSITDKRLYGVFEAVRSPRWSLLRSLALVPNRCPPPLADVEWPAGHRARRVGQRGQARHGLAVPCSGGAQPSVLA